MKSKWFVMAALVSTAGCGQAPSSPPSSATPPSQPAAAGSASARVASTAKYAAAVPASIVTPDTVQTRVGTLKFSDGLPDDDTVKKVYDHLDFARAVEAFMAGIPATSVEALKRGFIEVGFPPNEGIGITESRSDARSLFLTPNATVIYQWACVDVRREPMVIEVGPAVLGLVNDAYFRFLGDMGQFGPDQGKGGKFLVVPEAYTGAVPTQGYYVIKTRTHNNLVIIRSFLQNGDLAGSVKTQKERTRIYPLSAASAPPAQKFVNISGLKFNTVHANDFTFYEELNDVVQHEPG